MSRPFTLVCGSGLPLGGAHALLASQLAAHAKTLGFRFVRLEHSRCPRSRSRYLMLDDAIGRRWIVRVSHHRRTGPTVHAVPHLDIVSLDGVSGFEQAADFLGRAWRGQVSWFDPETAERRPRQKRRRRA